MDRAGVIVAQVGALVVVRYPDGRHELWDERAAAAVRDAEGARLLPLGRAPGERETLAVVLRLAGADPVPGLH
jgi:hypothetical protein